MFQEMGGCPAIWDLHEWVAWLTPTHFGSRRFNTAFFITFMEKIPKIVPDGKEIEDIKVILITYCSAKNFDIDKRFLAFGTASMFFFYLGIPHFC